MTDGWAGLVGRRGVLRGATGLAATLVAAPWYVRGARASSGELTLMNWSDELPEPVLQDFSAKTGIQVRTTPFSRVDEVLNKLEATEGQGFDLVQNALPRAPQFREQGLLQPWDESKLQLDHLEAPLLKASRERWSWDGGLYHIPHVWGTEGLAWRTDAVDLDPRDASWGLLWDESHRGKVIGRANSLISIIGLWLDANGTLPSNRLADTYADEARAREVFDKVLQFAVDHKPWVKQFWTGTDSIKSGFLTNGVTIGESWDGPILTMARAGSPVAFGLPKEGALTWIDGWSLPVGAKNVEQAYALVNYLVSPEASARVAELSGYNPVAKGALPLLSQAAQKTYGAIYGDVDPARLWTWPAQPPWHARLIAEYAERYKAA
ncbi:MAG: extracellular solute-binding protein [Paracoccus aminovorans]|nr:extracellular solute-binding protein [Paracoccus aminovorans]